MQKMQPIKVFVDQINDTIATLLLGDDESVKLSIPISWLPVGTREGDILHLNFTPDPTSTTDAKSRVQKLIDKLGDNP
jgi:hypothetical protein